MAYRAKLVDYGMENREVVFTDVDGVKHCVATSDDYGSRVTFSGIQAETLGNGKYVIVFAVKMTICRATHLITIIVFLTPR